MPQPSMAPFLGEPSLVETPNPWGHPLSVGICFRHPWESHLLGESYSPVPGEFKSSLILDLLNILSEMCCNMPAMRL